MARRASFWKHIGPGLVSGAADNDPTTVASLSVIASTTTYGLAWLVVLVIPMLAAVQVISARVGAAFRGSLQDAIAKMGGRPWALVALISILSVNIVTLAADLEGGAAALGLLTRVDYRWFILPFAIATAVLLVAGKYRSIENFLRAVAFIFVAYIVAALVARPDWHDVLRHTLIPHFSMQSDYVSGTIALLGTTLTSYAYVWETIEIAEEKPPMRYIPILQADAAAGILYTGAIMYFIVIATGATLGVHHKHVEAAQDAAAALAPLAGRYATSLFGIGLLASAMLAVPVLASTSAYVLAETFGWRKGLSTKPRRAPHFYASLLASLAVSVIVAYAGVSPIRLLFLASIAGGLATPITLVMLMLVAQNPTVMRGKPIGPTLAAAGWLVTAIVTAASVVFLYQSFTS